MIRLEHVSRTFREKSREVHALRDVSLEVRKGEIYGIVGFSGAGKSTLIRLVNRLETPDTGTVRVNGQDLAALKGKALTSLRAMRARPRQNCSPMCSGPKRIISARRRRTVLRRWPCSNAGMWLQLPPDTI